VTSNNRGEIQSKRELATSKGKEVVIDVLVTYSCSNFLANSPSPGIDLVEGPQVLIEVLEQKVNKTCDYESKRKFQVS
jgi:hypothetical protein